MSPQWISTSASGGICKRWCLSWVSERRTYSSVINSAQLNSGRASFLRKPTLSNSINPILILARTNFLAAPAPSWRAFLEKKNKTFSLGLLILIPAGVSFYESQQLFNSINLISIPAHARFFGNLLRSEIHELMTEL